MAVDVTLSNGLFSSGNDVVSGELTPINPTEDQIAVLSPPELIETQEGNDTITGEVDATLLASGGGLDYVGVQVEGTLSMEEGDDTLAGDVDLEIDGQSGAELFGIRGDNSKTISMGDGDDEVVGTAFATVANADNTAARGIFNAMIFAGAGLDTVHGSATIVAGEDTTGNNAIGILETDVDAGPGQAEVEGEAAILGGNDDVEGAALGIQGGHIETSGANDTVTGAATVVVGNNTDNIEPNSVTASGIFAATIQTGEGADNVTGHADISTGDDYTISGFGIEAAEVSTGPGADRVVGRVDIETGDGSTIETATGITRVGLDTAAGNDDITGLVEISGGAETTASGIFGIVDSHIDAGENDDTVVGGVFATLGADSTLADSAGISGGAEKTIVGATGSDITMGLLFAPGADGDPILRADVIQWLVDNTSPSDILGPDDGDDGPSSGHGDPGDAAAAFIDHARSLLGTGADGISIVNVAGIMDETVSAGPGFDLTLGLVGTTVGDDNAGSAEILDADGITGSTISTGLFGVESPGDSSPDAVGGITVNLGGEGAELAGNDGIEGSGSPLTIFVDEGAALVGGVSVNAVGVDGIAHDNNGIYNETIEANSDGDKEILGISVTEGAAGSDHTDIDGIQDTDITTGSGNDFILGASVLSSDSGAVDDVWGSGLLSMDSHVIDTNAGNDTVVGVGLEDDEGAGDSFGISGYEVRLGAGSDTLIARGATGGIDDVGLWGEGGDDVFNVHSGTGSIYGGFNAVEDSGEDTLILTGTSEDYDFAGFGDDDVTITDDDDDVPNTNIDAHDIETFVFLGSGEELTYEELFS